MFGVVIFHDKVITEIFQHYSNTNLSLSYGSNIEFPKSNSKNEFQLLRFFSAQTLAISEYSSCFVEHSSSLFSYSNLFTFNRLPSALVNPGMGNCVKVAVYILEGAFYRSSLLTEDPCINFCIWSTDWSKKFQPQFTLQKKFMMLKTILPGLEPKNRKFLHASNSSFALTGG